MPKKKYIKRPFPRKGVDWKQMRAKKELFSINKICG
tara:strand:- start:150 stop:257 length:108 start_codon:yes stop_codon:yes gene_type:complete